MLTPADQRLMRRLRTPERPNRDGCLDKLRRDPAIAALINAAAENAGSEPPSAIYRTALEPLELLGGWDLDFDDQEKMKQRLPRLTALCWDGPHGS